MQIRASNARSAGPFKMQQGVDPNVYVLDLPLNFSINCTFNIADLVAYHKQHHIPRCHLTLLLMILLKLLPL
jgi:hypothetical protein